METINGLLRKLRHRRPRAARCCSAAPPLPPGPICRNSRAPPTAAIRGWSSSSCAARSTGLPPSHRSAIPIMPACTVRSRSPSSGPNAATAARQFLRAASGDAGIVRGCIARRRRRSFTRWRRPIAIARISTDRMCSKAALPGRAGCSPAGSTARWKRLPRGERVTSGLAVGPTTPLVLRGAAPTVGWAPVALPQAADDTAMRLIDLYQQRDPALATALVARSRSSTRPRKATT